MASARSALSQGNYDQAVDDARRVVRHGGRDVDEAALIVARAYLRLDDPAAALEELLLRGTWSEAARVVAAVLTGIAEHRTGVKGAVRRIERAHVEARSADERAEAAYYRAWAAYRDRDLDVADRWVQNALDEARDVLEARAHALVGYISEAREDYAGSARAFRSALRSLRGAQEVDTQLAVAVMHNLAVYGAELPDPSLTELVASDWKRSAQAETAPIRIHAAQIALHVGIGLVNAGQSLNALSAFDEAALRAQDAGMIVATAHIEEADLLRILGEPISARRALRRAFLHMRETAEQIEDQMALLEATCVAARLEPMHANEWMTRYTAQRKADDGRWALTNDRRVQALELQARGLCDLIVGRRETGIRKVTEAMDLWTTLGYKRRAAYAYADLARLGAPADKAAFQKFAKVAPSHPIMTVAPTPHETRPISGRRLSPALAILVDDLCAGKSVRDIAQQSGRSEYTLRNHLKRLFKIFEVSSTAALVAAVMRSTETGNSASADRDRHILRHAQKVATGAKVKRTASPTARRR